jgi:hypothetical protein
MSETKVSRRSRGEDAIYFATAKNRYVGSVSLGYGPDGKRIRRKVFGKTKQEIRDRLKTLHQELNAGVKSSRTYTVRETVEDWLREGLDGTSERTQTLYEGLLGPVLEMIGARPLRDLTAGDVRSALGQLVTRYSTRSLQITRNSLERAIRHARVCRAEPAGRDPHRGGPRAALGSRGDVGGRCQRVAARHHGRIRRRQGGRRTLRDLRLARRAARRRYQDREVSRRRQVSAKTGCPWR